MKNMTDITYVDGYNLYIRNITKIPLLSKNEEYELALKYKNDQCKDSAYKLLTCNLRFVVKVANHFQRRYKNTDIMDLIQEGTFGLMRALKDFEPRKGFRFITYAVKWIRSYIQKFIIKNRNITSGFSREKYKQMFMKDQDRATLLDDIDIDSYEEHNILDIN